MSNSTFINLSVYSLTNWTDKVSVFYSCVFFWNTTFINFFFSHWWVPVFGLSVLWVFGKEQSLSSLAEPWTLPQQLPGLPWGPDILLHGRSWFIWESQWITSAGEAMPGQPLALFWTQAVPQHTLSWSSKASYPQTGNKPSSTPKENGGKEEDLISFLWWYFGTLFPSYLTTFLPQRQIVGMESLHPIPFCHIQIHAIPRRKLRSD